MHTCILGRETLDILVFEIICEVQIAVCSFVHAFLLKGITYRIESGSSSFLGKSYADAKLPSGIST